jgi:putative ABC transport system permease protein
MEMIGLASRNVFRNKRRSLLNAIAIALGVAIMFVCLGWIQGYATYIYGAVIRFQTGAAQILRSGYQEEAARFPLDLTVQNYGEQRERLLRLPGISAASGRIDFPARIITASGSMRLLAQGIDAVAERGVSVLSMKITKGSYLDASPGLLLGFGVADKLHVVPGSVVLVSATDRYGVENRIALTLRGVFSFGYGAMDDGLAFMDLASTQDLLDLGDEVTRVVLAGHRTDDVLRAAEGYVAKSNGLAAYGWQEFARATVSGVQTDSYSFYLVAVVIFALIVMGILNSMSMSVHERHRELATLRAIGFRSRDASLLILLESSVLAALATSAGLVLAAPLAAWLGLKGVDISSFIPKDFPIPFGEIYHADYRLWHLGLSAILGIATGIAGSMLPARRAARLPIAETIGSGL